jgi:hypothetical protein
LTKERNFTTPLCLESSRKRSADSSAASSSYQPPAKNANKGRPKGSGKGSGKKSAGKGAGKTPGCAPRTPEPDSKLICYKYNNEQTRCNNQGKCRFAHVCGVCFKKNIPMYKCDHQK